MAITNQKYDEELVKTDVGAALYHKWVRMRKCKYGQCEYFSWYPNFYRWAIDSGYEAGMQLRRYDEKAPYSPENCYFVKLRNDKSFHGEYRTQIEKWNKTVNKIRNACGMQPLAGTEDTTEDDFDAEE